MYKVAKRLVLALAVAAIGSPLLLTVGQAQTSTPGRIADQATMQASHGQPADGSPSTRSFQDADRPPHELSSRVAGAFTPEPNLATNAGLLELRVLHWNIYGVTGNQGTHEVVDRLIDRVELLRDDGLPIHVLSINETCLEQTHYAREQIIERIGTKSVRAYFTKTGEDWRCNGSGNEVGVGLLIIEADRVRDSVVRVYPTRDGGRRGAVCALASYESTLGHDVWACSAHLATRTEGIAAMQAVTLVTELEEKSRHQVPIVLAGDLNREPGHFDKLYAQGDGDGNYLEVDYPQNRPTFAHDPDSDPNRKLDYIFGDQEHLVPTFAMLFDGGKCWGWDDRCSDHLMLFGAFAFHGGGTGGQGPTRIVYHGPTEVPYHRPFTASARLTHSPKPGQDPTAPVSNARLTFTLGSGGGSQTCTGTTNASGVASCRLTATQRPGRTTLTVSYPGDGYAPASITVPFTITRAPTTTTYSGPKRVANGTPARLSGVLREKGGGPIEGRKLRLSLGRGKNQQACTGTTNSSGVARCTIKSVDQPLNAAATVPVQVRFAGDPYYLPSSKSATVLLEYYTGHAYGLTAKLGVPLVSLVEVSPTPDTGSVRTARAFTSTTRCLAEVEAGVLLTTGTVCPKATTTLAPGTSTSTTTVERVRIGLPGLPVIDARGATARSTSTCGSGGSATGSTDVELYIGGRRVPITAEVNAEIDLPGLARLVVNEQKPVAKADHGLTVNALHLTAGGGETDIVIASATSDVHNCAS